jgi:flagellar biosynthesis protein FliP
MRFIILSILIFISNNVLATGINIDFGETGEITSRIIQTLGLVTILSLAPSILVMITSFTRIVIVFSFLRTALGLQQSPPNTVLVSLALFLTFFIMNPVFEKSYNEGIQPLMEKKISEKESIELIFNPFKEFMQSHVRKNDVELFFDIAKTENKNYDDVPYKIIIPAFMISELRRAFEIGFLIFIPFVIIDLLVSSILMAMGMMMVPPAMLSLPCKIIFFVLIDGWYMICGSLVRSFGS